MKHKKKRYKENPIRFREAQLKYKYGINLNNYNDMFLKQNGCCKICLSHQSLFNKALSVDHNHDTGEIRGLLCAPCNQQLGIYEKIVKNGLLNKIIVYINRSQLKLVGES